MKRYIKSYPYIIEVEVEAYHPIFAIDTSGTNVAASRDFSAYDLPDGEIIAKDKKRITRSMERDFESCMIMIEDFCQENMGLIGTYKNVSNDNSYYYNYLATDDNGDIIIDYRMRLRISNHEASSTKEQKWNKKQEEHAPKLQDLLNYDQISKLRKKYLNIVVNNEDKFTNYFDAADFIMDEIELAVESMKKYQKYRKKQSVPERYHGTKGFEVIPEETGSNGENN